jgi:GTP cyclohydrolase I
MGVTLESEIQQDRSMALLLTDETKTDRLERTIRDLITELGLDITDQHVESTPARVARLYRELTRGSRMDPAKILKTFDSKHSELIVVSEINFYSLCPHHLLIYRGKMHFGYVPGGKIVGLSKIPRLIHVSPHRARRSGFRDSGHSCVGCEAFGLRGACYGSARLRGRPRSEVP